MSAFGFFSKNFEAANPNDSEIQDRAYGEGPFSKGGNLPPVARGIREIP